MRLQLEISSDNSMFLNDTQIYRWGINFVFLIKSIGSIANYLHAYNDLGLSIITS